ncbi:hypothetical protein SLEP1_g43164 [Rubroshorea leprosula]|uniref:CCT-theta n=1 Tax=Rubroshorea leprosula TaxID=152421 RepID=A0AAV5LC38_9ROSI|nr:hypothetical protein SLEP1_g43164 [Rubroshorea leprosula]
MGFSMQPYGIKAMLKEGHKHMSGLEEVVLKNIDAYKELSAITRTSLGPNGASFSLFVTNDAATIVNELEVQHLAAKILVLAGKAQQEEMGDGANLTISFAGELLQNAEELIRASLHPSEIISGYTKAIDKTVEILGELVEKGSESMDVRVKEQVITRRKAAVASKQFGQKDVLFSLIVDACMQVCPKNPSNFDVDNVHVAKLLGGGLHNSTIVQGMVLKNKAVGSIKRIEKAKLVVEVQRAGSRSCSRLYRVIYREDSWGLSCKGVRFERNTLLLVKGLSGSFKPPLILLVESVEEIFATETKGTVLIHSAEQLENYDKTEEAKIEELIKAVADSGAKVIVSGGAVGEMALHFSLASNFKVSPCKLMVLKISSKFELRRFCHTIGDVALLKLSRPKPDDLGHVDSVSVEEIGGVHEEGGNRVSTLVLQGSTDSILDHLKRAVDDGVNMYKLYNWLLYTVLFPLGGQAMCRDSRMVPGVAATEIELDQYAITKFAESFELIPRTPAENAGLNAMDIISRLYEKHASRNAKVGVDLAAKGGEGGGLNCFAINLCPATFLDAACTALRVGQVIQQKEAGSTAKVKSECDVMLLRRWNDFIVLVGSTAKVKSECDVMLLIRWNGHVIDPKDSNFTCLKFTINCQIWLLF